MINYNRVETMNDVLHDMYTNYFSDYVDLYTFTANKTVFMENLLTHKYWLNTKYKEEIPLSKAYDDWSEYVLSQFLYYINRFKLLKYSNFNIINLYEIIMNNWHFEKQNIDKSDRPVYIQDIISDYCLYSKKYPIRLKLLIILKLL